MAANPEGSKDTKGRPTRPKLAPQLAQHVEDFLAGKAAANTRAAYKAALTEFLADVAGVADLRRIDHRNVTAWRNTLIERGLSKPSVNLKLSAIRGFFDFLVGLALLPGNPASGKLVRGYKLSGESKTRGLSAEEADALAAACDDGTLCGARDKAIIYLGVIQGLRRSEIAHLRPKSIRTQGETAVLLLEDTKTAEFARQPLDERVLAVIEDYLGANPRKLGPEDPLFHSLSRNGGAPGQKLRPLTGKSVNDIIQKRATIAGLKSVTAHVMRHGCCTLALEGGAKLEWVQAHLRHRDPKTTIRYYRNMQALRSDATRAIRLGKSKRS